MLPRYWYEIKDLLRRMDFFQLAFILVLLAVGCLAIYSTGQQTGGSFAGFWLRQLNWILMGSGVYFLASVLHYQKLGRLAWVFYLLSLTLLILVLFTGRTINHSKSWLPVFGTTIQPAEFAKPAMIFFLTWLASRPSLRLQRVWNLVPLGLVLIPPVVLIGLQPDWGTALVFGFIALAVIFVSGLAWKWLLLGLILGVTLALPAYQFGLAPHQQARIRTFLHPADDISDAGWNAHQSLLAVGSGGLTGKGFMKGTQNVLGFLPRTVAPTDFIFSVVAEENGFIGAAIVMIALVGIVICCLRTAMLAADDFGAYLSVGVAALFFLHTYINIGMTIQAAPIIGIPLPFVSYGGSFMLSCMLCAGLIQSVYIRRPTGRHDE